MREFYIFDGTEFELCSEALMQDLINLCEDNEIMIKAIKKYFKVEK